MKKAKILIICTVMALILTMQSAAFGTRSVTVKINGNTVYQGSKLFLNGVTYVPFRDFYEEYEGASVSWSSSGARATARSGDVTVTAQSGQSYIVANGRYIYYAKNINVGGRVYIPLRSAIKTLNGTTDWSQSSYTASAKTGSGGIKSGDSYYDQTDLYWLSRIISAESKGESLYGKIAVGNVVLNRVKSASYPGTVKEVIFDTKHGVQFTPVANVTIYDEPTAESIVAAKICLEGYTVNSRIMYFMNEALSTNSWISQNCKYVFSIGNHDFYA